MPKFQVKDGRIIATHDETNPKDMKKKMKKDKSYMKMSKPELVKLVETLLMND